MCRAHRIITMTTIALWGMVLWLIFGVYPDAGPWRMMTYGLLGLAVVLVPYCLYPWLMREMMAVQVKDLSAAFLAGWEAAREDDGEPKGPVKIHLVG